MNVCWKSFWFVVSLSILYFSLRLPCHLSPVVPLHVSLFVCVSLSVTTLSCSCAPTASTPQHRQLQLCISPSFPSDPPMTRSPTVVLWHSGQLPLSFVPCTFNIYYFPFLFTLDSVDFFLPLTKLKFSSTCQPARPISPPVYLPTLHCQTHLQLPAIQPTDHPHSSLYKDCSHHHPELPLWRSAYTQWASQYCIANVWLHPYSHHVKRWRRAIMGFIVM